MSKFERQGYSLPSKPKLEIPVLPRDITELPDDALMDLFVVFTSWSDHLAGQVALATIDEREAQRILDVTEARLMVGNWKGGSGDRIAIAKAGIAGDPTVVELSDELAEKYAYRKLVEVLANNVERDSAVVSRELTRRTSGDSFKGRARRFQS